METKNEKFIRLSGQRTEKATGFIQSLKKLMAPTYESSEVERKSIVDDLYASVDDLAETFDLEKGKIPVAGEPDEPSEAIKYLDSIVTPCNTAVLSDPLEDEELMGIAPTINTAINLIADGSPNAARIMLIRLLAS